jgi:hypothetical protein
MRRSARFKTCFTENRNPGRKALVAALILASLSLVGSVASFLVTLMKHG